MKAAIPLPPPPELDTERMRAAFDAHLREEGYTQLTAHKSTVILHQLIEMALNGEDLPTDTNNPRIGALRALRWLRKLEATHAVLSTTEQARKLKAWLEDVLQDEVVVDPAPKKVRLNKLEKLSTAQWKKLIHYLEAHATDAPEALVVLVAIYTPLRIGRVLDMPLTKIRDITRNANVQARLDALMGTYKTMTNVLTDRSQNAAYVRMKRYLREVSEDLGFDFDFNTISRTRSEQPRV